MSMRFICRLYGAENNINTITCHATVHVAYRAGANRHRGEDMAVMEVRRGSRRRSLEVDMYSEHEPMGRGVLRTCLLYTSPSPRDGLLSRMPSSA